MDGSIILMFTGMLLFCAGLLGPFVLAVCWLLSIAARLVSLLVRGVMFLIDGGAR